MCVAMFLTSRFLPQFWKAVDLFSCLQCSFVFFESLSEMPQLIRLVSALNKQLVSCPCVVSAFSIDDFWRNPRRGLVYSTQEIICGQCNKENVDVFQLVKGWKVVKDSEATFLQTGCPYELVLISELGFFRFMAC